jgi:hypothetical protein
MSYITGGMMPSMCAIHFSLSLLTFLMIFFMFIDWAMWGKPYSGFENMADYGIKQRGDVVAAVPAYEEESMRQKVDRWVSGTAVSNLTGSRDPPVFFQDNAVEATRAEGKAVSSSREGFEGGKGEDELERALAGRH